MTWFRKGILSQEQIHRNCIGTSRHPNCIIIIGIFRRSKIGFFLRGSWGGNYHPPLLESQKLADDDYGTRNTHQDISPPAHFVLHWNLLGCFGLFQWGYFPITVASELYYSWYLKVRFTKI